jgi:hypothetical protein
MTGSYEQEQEEAGSKSKRKLGARARGSWEQEQEEVGSKSKRKLTF